MSVETLIKQGATLQDVEDWLFEGRIGFDTVAEYVDRWNDTPGRFHIAEFKAESWRSGIRLVEKK